MSNIKELIREKIDAFYAEYKAKFHQNGDSYHLGIIDGLDIAERILDTLPDEPEQRTRGYDESYLNKKIAKASKSWEGVDVDKFMDEIRGREPVTDCRDLTEAARQYVRSRPFAPDESEPESTRKAFIAGAEWQKRKMMEGAVEGVVYRYESYQRIATAIIVDVPKESLDNKVRIIILPEED